MDIILLFMIFVIGVIGYMVYTQQAQISVISTSQDTSNTSLQAVKDSVTANSSAISALITTVTSVQTTLASRSNTTSLTSLTSTITPTFTSSGNVQSATCSSVYTAISDIVSDVNNIITVTPIAASTKTIVTIPINKGPLSSIQACNVSGLLGDSDTSALSVNNLVALVDLTAQTIQVSFTSNSTSAHIIRVNAKLK